MFENINPVGPLDLMETGFVPPVTSKHGKDAFSYYAAHTQDHLMMLLYFSHFQVLISDDLILIDFLHCTFIFFTSKLIPF